MWGYAKNLTEKAASAAGAAASASGVDVKTPTKFLSKLGDVVAPPADSDEDYESGSGSDYDSDEEYEEEEEYDVDDGGETEEELVIGGGGHAGRADAAAVEAGDERMNGDPTRRPLFDDDAPVDADVHESYDHHRDGGRDATQSMIGAASKIGGVFGSAIKSATAQLGGREGSSDYGFGDGGDDDVVRPSMFDSPGTLGVKSELGQRKYDFGGDPGTDLPLSSGSDAAVSSSLMASSASRSAPFSAGAVPSTTVDCSSVGAPPASTSLSAPSSGGDDRQRGVGGLYAPMDLGGSVEAYARKCSSPSKDEVGFGSNDATAEEAPVAAPEEVETAGPAVEDQTPTDEDPKSVTTSADPPAPLSSESDAVAHPEYGVDDGHFRHSRVSMESVELNDSGRGGVAAVAPAEPPTAELAETAVPEEEPTPVVAEPSIKELTPLPASELEKDEDASESSPRSWQEVDAPEANVAAAPENPERTAAAASETTMETAPPPSPLSAASDAEFEPKRVAEFDPSSSEDVVPAATKAAPLSYTFPDQPVGGSLSHDDEHRHHHHEQHWREQSRHSPPPHESRSAWSTASVAGTEVMESRMEEVEHMASAADAAHAAAAGAATEAVTSRLEGEEEGRGSEARREGSAEEEEEEEDAVIVEKAPSSADAVPSDAAKDEGPPDPEAGPEPETEPEPQPQPEPETEPEPEPEPAPEPEPEPEAAPVEAQKAVSKPSAPAVPASELRSDAAALLAAEAEAAELRRTVNGLRSTEVRAAELERTVDSLRSQLAHSEGSAAALRAAVDEARQRKEAEVGRLREDESRRIAEAEASASRVAKAEVDMVKHAMEKKRRELELRLKDERETASQVQNQLRKLLDDATDRAEEVERSLRVEMARTEGEVAKTVDMQARVAEKAEEKAGRAMALLDERDGELRQLQAVIADMRKVMSKDKEGHDEAEQELDELHDENEELEKRVEVLEGEKAKLKKELSKLEADRGKVLGLHMEVQMLQEERDRDRARVQSTTESSASERDRLHSERDAAKAEASDAASRLAALRADLDLAESDRDRAVLASSNLQRALEAFQVEREAETDMIEEQRSEVEVAAARAHAAAMEATQEANEARMREVQMAADSAVRNVMVQVDDLERTIEHYKKENLNMRRSLDEAIHRLQTSQEDVIDRSLMKNILLDWGSKHGKARRDVLELMASVLHFTEDEKDKMGIGEGSHDGTISKVVHAVTAPLPPPSRSMEQLEGDNVREKWVNFLLAEAGDDDNAEGTKSPTTSGRKKGSNHGERRVQAENI